MGEFKTIDLRIRVSDASFGSDTINLSQEGTPGETPTETTFRRQIIAISEGVHNGFEFAADELQNMVENSIAKKVNESRNYLSAPIILDHSNEFLKKVGATVALNYEQAVETRSGTRPAVLAIIELWGDTPIQRETQARVKQDPENTYFSIRVYGECVESDLEEAWWGKLTNLQLIHIALVNEPADSNTGIVGELTRIDEEFTEGEEESNKQPKDTRKEDEQLEEPDPQSIAGTEGEPETKQNEEDLATITAKIGTLIDDPETGIESFHKMMETLTPKLYLRFASSDTFSNTTTTKFAKLPEYFIGRVEDYDGYYTSGGRWGFWIDDENQDKKTGGPERSDLILNTSHVKANGMETADLQKKITNLESENAALKENLEAEKARADKAEQAFADFKEKMPHVAAIKALDGDISEDFLLTLNTKQIIELKTVLERNQVQTPTTEKGFDQGNEPGEKKTQGPTCAELAKAYEE